MNFPLCSKVDSDKLPKTGGIIILYSLCIAKSLEYGIATDQFFVEVRSVGAFTLDTTDGGKVLDN